MSENTLTYDIRQKMPATTTEKSNPNKQEAHSVSYFVTPRGRQLLDLLSHDITRLAASGIILFNGESELDQTLSELHACHLHKFDEIRPVTIERGLISYHLSKGSTK